MFSEVLERFVDKSPVTVMVRGLLENLLSADKLDRWFEATCARQYTRKILFSSLVGLMLQVVCRTRASIHEAYRASMIAASVVAVYGKLKGVEPTTSRAFVQVVAGDAERLIDTLGGTRPARLPGYRVKYLDGNCLAATEHRLKPLRETAAGALPGKSLVVFQPHVGLATDVFPCIDGHAQERALLGPVVATVEAGDLWIADRNFCVLAFLSAIHARGAAFVIRQHANLIAKPLSKIRVVGKSSTGKVDEQPVELTAADGTVWQLRRIVIKLSQATRDGETTLNLLTNLPDDVADAIMVAELYRQRWGIETAFQKLERHLNSEISTLGYPQAALFGFCLALVAFNLYAVVMAALRAAHPTRDIDAEVSEYYIAGEIAATYTGLEIAVCETDWEPFAHADTQKMCTLLFNLAQRVDLKRLLKTPRGPKKPRTPRTKFKGKPHVSTAKLLAGR
ncbi:hypothetical protein CCR95_15340 [Thiocystis minor]|uniref:transposase n=1 Tax=Thiocystis minor TaxID=61597 RepID=UPI0019149AF9|nr:transposase [Thiocystis minor]MBK5965425.1 hypothetical protein [Thiocystis minor]